MDVWRDLLDHQLYDRDGTACGRVDDVVVEYDAAGARLVSLLSGGDVLLDQLGVLGRLLRPLLRFRGARRSTELDWALVARVEDDGVRLLSPRAALGLYVPEGQ